MDFAFSPEQQALADSVARFTERDYPFEARMKLVNGGGGFDAGNWRTFAELGWLGAGLSEDAGGYGGGPVETMIVMERFGGALVLEPFLPVAVLALQTLAALPSGVTRDALIAAIIGGETRVAMAHGEAAARGDIGFVETRIEGGRISGAKSLVLAAPFADRLIVSARGEGGGIGLYLVDPAASGVVPTPYRLLDNSRAADIAFDSTPIEAVLAAPGEGEEALAAGHAQVLVGLCAEAVGAMDAAIGITRDYVKTRTQFGTTLSSFQAVQHRMADMLVECEMSRSMVYQGIASIGLPTPARTHALSAMKAIVSAAAMFVGRNAVQLHGGIGITEEYAIGHHYRRLFVIAAQFGGEAEHLRNMAANPRPFWSEDGQTACAAGGRVADAVIA